MVVVSSTRARRSSTSAASRRDRVRRASRWTRSSRASSRCSRACTGVPISIDTSKAEVARRALELGAELVNDVTALRADPAMAGVVAEGEAFVCLMHMQGEPRTMQAAPHYDDVVSEVLAFLEERAGLRGRQRDPRGADLHRPWDRIRQDVGPQPRAPATPRRAPRPRPTGARRYLAQEHARQDSRRRRGRRRGASPRRSLPPSRPSSAARR